MEQKKQTATEQLAWINRLPEEGGAWGLGIVETAKSIEDEMVRLEAQEKTIKDQIKARKKLLKATIRRAEKEAPLLFPADVVETARGSGEIVVDVD